ncbi:uncharacterized protein LACBIDRAFT_331258 [Laccaria bicolor S238N-H82]|uniref:Predicted protein n=1 Tax=Laccaria bicolor (strain S238N-H82 / ATCC MYA-4686) TaxID=486041 RepID=B0DNY5_LACBS|nr:uncharacterized protein LACBIDRAFT_331258 [Laccaria bicolor S238N-H82]EDR03730.1 predicted protein [Laccaria bicolor S238N-H82]|eukprot:XP_001885583.1 predicted protein [Laccaria bicolor S238N-H82]
MSGLPEIVPNFQASLPKNKTRLIDIIIQLAWMSTIRLWEQKHFISLKALNFANAACQMGSSVAIISSAYRLRECLAQILYLYQENTADLFPKKIAHISHESIMEFRAPERCTRHGQFRYPAVQQIIQYIYDLTDEMGEHIDGITSSLCMFIDVGVPIICFLTSWNTTLSLMLSTLCGLHQWSLALQQLLIASWGSHGNKQCILHNSYSHNCAYYHYLIQPHSCLCMKWLSDVLIESIEQFVQTPVVGWIQMVIKFLSHNIEKIWAVLLSLYKWLRNICSLSKLDNEGNNLEANGVPTTSNSSPNHLPSHLEPSNPNLGCLAFLTTSSGHPGPYDRKKAIIEPVTVLKSCISTLAPKLAALEATQDLAAHNTLVHHLEFSPDGTFLASSR